MKFQLVLALIFSINVIYGQYGQSKLFPGVEGDELLELIVENYKSDSVFLSYGQARDTMFSLVDGQNDSLKCVYSEHTLYLDPNEDPTTYVYLNGSKNGINTEHSYPRSKGAENGNARSDMHHLFPTRTNVNAIRGNSPFGEIPDVSTDTWFYKSQEISSIPSKNIDKYSEYKTGVFEPKEDFKGNISRALMYFYTMYRNEADQADPDFFWDMLPTLCEWHFQDPVDSVEYARSNLIAKWQEFPNPFVLDCSLASRTYCSLIDDACELAVPSEDIIISDSKLNAYYSVVERAFIIQGNVEGLFQIYDLSGKKLLEIQNESSEELRIPFNNQPNGLYLLQAIYRDQAEYGSESILLNVYK